MTRDDPKTAAKNTRGIIDAPYSWGAVFVSLPVGSGSNEFISLLINCIKAREIPRSLDP